MKDKTVLINCSPKRRLSVSGFLMRCTALLLRDRKVCMQLRTPADRAPILQELKMASKAVFVLPLYVDSVPSHVLPFLQELEAFSRENALDLKLYVIANNGFIEGRQNEPLMQVMENFCRRSGLTWCGGIGIGGGVMVNVMRIMLPVLFALTLLNIAGGCIRGESILEPVRSFGASLLEALLLGCGIIAYILRLARHITRGTDAGKRYTRIMLPSFIFILAADIFFTIISFLQGGIFRGWFSRFAPDAGCGIMEQKQQ